MGLDISLYSKAQADQNERHEKEWDELWERKSSGEITEEEYEVERKLITQYDYSSHSPETKSKTNPEHLFNRRYLRSSYNAGGFNSVAGNFGGHDLYWIFEPLETDPEEGGGWLSAGSIENLKACRDRALQVAQEIRDWDRLMVTEFSGPILGDADHLWSKLPTEEKVLEWGREELSKKQPDGFGDGGYSTAKGSVFPSGFTLHAITLGMDKYGFRGIPIVAYGVYKATEETFTFYEEAARITAEFCEEAIDMIERDGAVSFSWSG